MPPAVRWATAANSRFGFVGSAAARTTSCPKLWSVCQVTPPLAENRTAPYPVERTLLTSGRTAAGLRSRAEGKRETPHLAVKYEAPRESTFWRE